MRRLSATLNLSTPRLLPNKLAGYVFWPATGTVNFSRTTYHNKFYPLFEPMFEIVIFTLLIVAGWFWLDSTRVREAAIALGKDACRRENLILLDYTVAIASIRIRRNCHGRFALRRIYNFEFSDTGNNRLNGTIILLGRELELLNLEKRYLETQQLH